ncbi:MAG: hypothetical protein IPL46_05035 [Saprospiraceae bacterium]|nr:hypothetical protein [Saprospiraceae bacterium]
MNNPKPHLSYLSRWILVLFSLSTLFIDLQDQDSLDIRYLSPSTIPFDWELDIADTVEILDTVTGDVVYQVISKKGYPLYFYQEVADNVCFDNKCRPIDLKIYWNITGRYFGFMLEDGEFLSRRDHEAFDSTDYNRLHTLLADPLLPFFNLSFEELVDQKDVNSDQVDGVTGATSKQLSDYVVEGAAYTTYVLWTGLYGSARTVVRHTTESHLDNKLLSKILESSSSMDHIWALGKINGSEKLDSSIEKRLLKLIEGDDFFVCHGHSGN